MLGEMISEELKSFYNTISIPSITQDLLLGHSILYMEDIKLVAQASKGGAL